jgi:hypothetical protein
MIIVPLVETIDSYIMDIVLLPVQMDSMEIKPTELANHVIPTVNYVNKPVKTTT